MGNVTIFQDLTTDEKLSEYESNGEKYTGLYVDMDNKDERKYVKDKAEEIKKLIKALDRKRIDTKKAFADSVEKEAADIKARLESANEPFTLLIDEWNEKRAKILAEKKAEEDAIEAFKQLQADHELALLMNDKFDSEFEQREFEKQRAEQQRLDEIEKAKEQAAEQARQEQIARHEAARKAEREEKEKREADIAHISGVRTIAKQALMNLDIEEQLAKKIIIAIHNNLIPNVRIDY